MLNILHLQSLTHAVLCLEVCLNLNTSAIFLIFLQIVREGLGCIKDENPDEALIKKVVSRLMTLFSSANINLRMISMHRHGYMLLLNSYTHSDAVYA